MARMQDKIALITGGAWGIGRAAAELFAREGAKVAIADIDEASGVALARDIGASALFIRTDVTDEASVAAAFEQVRQRYDRFDCLYTCAAVQLIGEDAPVHELDTAVWDRTYAVNSRGVFLTCKYGARLMIESGNGGA